MKSFLAFLGAILIVPLLVIYSSFSWGYVATVIYSWFVLPLFPDLHVFTWLEFAGIMFFVSCFVSPPAKEIKDEYKDSVSIWANAILNPWVLLLAAWIFHFIY